MEGAQEKEEEEESAPEEEPLGGVTATLVQLPTVGRGTGRALPTRCGWPARLINANTSYWCPQLPAPPQPSFG